MTPDKTNKTTFELSDPMSRARGNGVRVVSDLVHILPFLAEMREKYGATTFTIEPRLTPAQQDEVKRAYQCTSMSYERDADNGRTID
jgi:hypothetical protein